MKTIYVGNIPFRTTEEDIREMFEEYGTVHSVNFINDRETGKFRGFGFVEMDDAEAGPAVENINGKEIAGRALKVNEARERAERTERRPGGYNRQRN
ncbi:MAG: RNA-binding protein [Candidatus Cloacimonetes bacterium]|nr:RNA-binding protein [Candidatus Cloacimonadota bacterium]